MTYCLQCEYPDRMASSVATYQHQHKDIRKREKADSILISLCRYVASVNQIKPGSH